jgi:hypothetical protein
MLCAPTEDKWVAHLLTKSLPHYGPGLFLHDSLVHLVINGGIQLGHYLVL